MVHPISTYAHGRCPLWQIRIQAGALPAQWCYRHRQRSLLLPSLTSDTLRKSPNASHAPVIPRSSGGGSF